MKFSFYLILKKKYFNFKNIKSTFIGHPVYHIPRRNVKNNYKYIAFLFGSRENEINKLFKYFNYLEKYINANHPEYIIFIPTLPHLRNIIEKKISTWKTKTIISNEINNFNSFYDEVFVSITCSGTASLEIAKRNVPQLIIYKLNYLTEIILKLFVKVRYACLLNIISNKVIIPEIVNSRLSKKNLLLSFEKLINDNEFRKEQINNVNYFLSKIETNKSPFEISAERIIKLI